MFFDKTDYRDILRDELADRMTRNKNYSLRAFARDIGITPSRLSQLLAKKQGISLSLASKIADKLSFKKNKKNYFCDLVESFHARNSIKKELAQKRLLKYQKPKTNKISIDHFKIISDWYHYAILELLNLDDFKFSIETVSKKLGLNNEITLEAIERLKRLNLIKEENGKLIDTHETFSTGDIPSDAIKKFHSQILEKASQAIFNQKTNERDFSSIILSLDKNDLAKIKEIIKNSRRKIAQEISDSQNKNAVYCLSMQFFNILEE